MSGACHRSPRVRANSQAAAILRALCRGTLTGAQIAELIDDITPYVARTMAKLRHRGLVTNLRLGRGGVGVYQITSLGAAALRNSQAAS